MTYLCDCKGITEADAREWGRLGIKLSAEDLIEVLGLRDTGSCGRCALEIHKYLALMSQGATEDQGDRGP